ncbi:thiol:disulfide interchange protein DsbA/DsbL [Aggregatibacter actinomycetemcomitans]|uniref:thiol:disulfide interchange protein DsbA/DsbL n=1 Tax=Aggregatibacter actinomycetemcomitans TaxID=714 RepID=UPI00197B1EF9|nr:thiol:disulfide interchange protein DsbA/DsbL [Aggregatibacter actinomycetemcomitans]MBN6078364.1 thiol:disulfide interchange protein DsbA/DsbL [Aggregatibacter actinomycetemcomitans]
MLRVGLFIMLLCVGGFAAAQAGDESVAPDPAVLLDEESPEFEDGKDYFSYEYPIAMPARNDHRVIIQFFFDYDCRVCSSAQDILELYTQINRDRVVLEEFPVATNKARFTAGVFFSLQALNAEHLSSALLFETSERQRYIKLSRIENLVHWLQKQGIDRDSFLEMYHSDQIHQQVNDAVLMTEEYGVFTFPYVIINGKYVLTASTLYNDDYALAVLDFLVNKK